MNIQIRYKKAKVSADLKKYLAEKVEKFEKIMPKNTVFEVELRSETRSKKGKNKVINFTVDIPGEKIIHIGKAAVDFRSAIDIAQEKLEKALSKWHNRKVKKSNKRDRSINAKEILTFIPNLFIKKQKDDQTKFKNLYSGKPIYVEDAINKFNNQKEPFLIFKNIENGKISIISKNKNKIIIYTIVS